MGLATSEALNATIGKSWEKLGKVGKSWKSWKSWQGNSNAVTGVGGRRARRPAATQTYELARKTVPLSLPPGDSGQSVGIGR